MKVEKELLSISFAVSLYTLILLIFNFFSDNIQTAECNLAEHLQLCFILFSIHLRYYHRRIGRASEVFPRGVKKILKSKWHLSTYKGKNSTPSAKLFINITLRKYF